MVAINTEGNIDLKNRVEIMSHKNMKLHWTPEIANMYKDCMNNLDFESMVLKIDNLHKLINVKGHLT